MATTRDQIEHFDHYYKVRGGEDDKPWKNYSHSRRWLKKQMNRYIRRKGKKIEDDEQGNKQGRKPYSGYEY